MNYPTQPAPRSWYRQSGRKARKSDRFIAIDGEGITHDPNAKQDYVMLGTSTGEYIQTKRGHLKTLDCFEFLLSLRGGIITGFYFDYDINMILRDVEQPFLEELKERNWTQWGGYKITWIPHKLLRLSKGKERVTVWDCSGFFHCSFVKALQAWDIANPETIQAIEDMKEQRGDFASSDTSNMLTYCLKECELLEQLMDKLRDTLESLSPPIRLRQWFGGGAIASALLERHNVKQYRADPPQELREIELRAFYGGHFETAAIGPIPDGFDYDINSAYPDQLRQLPCLKCGTWRKSKSVRPTGVYHVDWSGSGSWGPLPWRFPQGAKLYPKSGEGWYWGSEVAAALSYWPKVGRGNQIKVKAGWLYETNCGHQPFKFVEDVYSRRKELSAVGDLGAVPLKLGLNSIYGKTAQSIGHQNKRPPYQSWVWAGMVTAGVRASILDAVAQNPKAVMAIATDGIMSTKRLALPVGENLGEWTQERVTDVFLVKNGVYQYLGSDGKLKTKNRGFRKKDLDFKAIRKSFEMHGINTEWTTGIHHFVGLREALHQTPKLRDWLKWVKVKKTSNLLPINKDFEDEPTGGRRYLRTFPLPTEGLSAPYKPKQTWKVEDDRLAPELEIVLLGKPLPRRVKKCQPLNKI